MTQLCIMDIKTLLLLAGEWVLKSGFWRKIGNKSFIYWLDRCHEFIVNLCPGHLLGFFQPWPPLMTHASKSPSFSAKFDLQKDCWRWQKYRNSDHSMEWPLQWSFTLLSLTADGGEEPTSVDWKMVNRCLIDYYCTMCILLLQNVSLLIACYGCFLWIHYW